MSQFTRDTTIYKDEDVLRDSYTPDDLIERDEEMQRYNEGLTPIINNSEPNNILVYGQTGVGKTLATRLILDDLCEGSENYDDIDVETVWINCEDSTSYQVAVDVINNLRGPNNKISSTGHAKRKVYDQMWKEIDNADATHLVVVLDEVDALGTDSDLLYQIPRAKDNGEIEDTELGLVGISNDFKFRESLSAKVQSSLCEHEIHFKPYDADQLRPILEQRAEGAFYPGVLENDVIPLCASIAANDTGSARHAIDMLHKAGSLARMRGDDTVTEKHTREAEELVEKSRIMDELLDLPTQYHLVLQALLNLEKRGQTPARRRDIYSVYTEAAESHGMTKKSSRTVHNRLSDLCLNGYMNVTEKNEGKEGGKYNTYEFDMAPEIIKEVLVEETNLLGEPNTESETLDSY